MGRKVLISYRIMPEDVETNLEEIKAQVKEVTEKGEVKDIKEEPVAFGLKALKVLVMVEDEKGVSDELEEKFKSIPGVESVETESITLI